MTQKKNVNEPKVGGTRKTTYEKPLFVERQELAFPKEIWEKFNGGRFCIQCSGCHGCR
jgi:hypothetical protein